jgi:tRNA pseudouridine38-40 synthase
MRYLMYCSYDGSNYYGFQSQVNQLGIQEVIEKSIKNMTQQKVKIHSAGRTDKGVHAYEQAFHVDIVGDFDLNTMKVAINKRLPEDIRILKIKIVKDDFHARHNAQAKKYVYKMSKKPLTAFQSKYYTYVHHLDYELMKDASQLFIGTHDFKGFCEKVIGKPTIKTIFDIKVTETTSTISFEFFGNSFLKYMVRSMMGTLIEIGQHKKLPEVITLNLVRPDRTLAGKTAAAKGLYLKKIYYKKVL